jgi:hypothetical protein
MGSKAVGLRKGHTMLFLPVFCFGPGKLDMTGHMVQQQMHVIEKLLANLATYVNWSFNLGITWLPEPPHPPVWSERRIWLRADILEEDTFLQKGQALVIANKAIWEMSPCEPPLAELL